METIWRRLLGVSVYLHMLIQVFKAVFGDQHY